MKTITGRKPELEILSEALESNRSELIAIYGRRRVGKTFLIREYFGESIRFEVTGLFRGTMHDQLENFTREIRKRSGRKKTETPRKWMDAFTLLESYLNTLKGKKKKVIFIDEFPWIATQKSKFLMSFENFWNRYASKRNDLIVIICGSAASYMVQNIIKNKGGLHNRISHKIRLMPFNLSETEEFLRSRRVNLTQYDILRLYMVMGGVPHYLEKIKRGMSVVQNIDKLCFSKDGVLNDEFNQLFASLFDDSHRHLKIIDALASVKKGLSREDLIKKTGMKGGGDLSKKLEELIESGFITDYNFYGNKSKNTLYRLTDEYVLFYLKFIRQASRLGPGTWQRLSTSQSYTSWCGLSFENICLKHIAQLKKALGIEAVYSENSSWSNEHAQVDLVIDRDDNFISLLEMKFYQAPFQLTHKTYQELKSKISEFKACAATRKNIQVVLISPWGVKPNKYSIELADAAFDAKVLFV